MRHLQCFYSRSESSTVPYFSSARRVRKSDKVIGKLVNGVPTIPGETYLTKEIVDIRRSLPIFDHRDQIVETIRNNQIVIVSSETGSGKTTQVPQYIMEDMKSLKRTCKIICTQPRRISTVAAAERVTFERGDSLGASVGYHIRLEQKYGLTTNLIYCTIGILLRNLMYTTDALYNITHIIIDEIHERDKLSDFLLICLKQILAKFPNLKIILMSATVNTNKFVEYFRGGVVLSIPGRLYGIDTYFLEDILYKLQYKSPKMREMEQKQFETETLMPGDNGEMACASTREVNLIVDEALDDYLHFSEVYDYRVHYEEATAQLGMYFLSEGVSVDYQHSRTGRTALMIAAYLGDKEFISRLCNMGANIDLCCNFGRTAFHYAEGKPDTLQLLDYIKNKRNSEDTSINKDAEHLLLLFDKTTSDDYIDYNLIVELIQHVHNSGQKGSILVFLPGYDDIMFCADKIEDSNMTLGTYKTFFLHSSMSIRDQHEVFKNLCATRKIILSTNIAETSITIDDVVFVIDTGKAKEKCYDSYNKVSSLQTQWISRACAKQRSGRAGRTRPGICFRLFSKQRFDSMDEERVPEILRVSLEELCLHTKVIAPEGMNIHNFLALAPDPPSANSIRVAIESLQFLGALDKEEDLTVLGEYLAQLTIEPHLAKMLIFSVIFKCLEPVLTLCASMAHKDPFLLPPQANLKTKAAEKRRELLDDVLSDHLLFLEVFKHWQDASHRGCAGQFCRAYFVSLPTMNSILETRSQLLGQLRAAGFVNQTRSLDAYNENADCWPLVKAIICMSVYPNLAYPMGGNLATRSEKRVSVHSSSSVQLKKVTTWLLYDELIKQRSGLHIRGVSAVTTITASLVCGIDTINPTPTTINIDDWLEFEFPDNSAIYFRCSMEKLIKKVLDNPSYNYRENDHFLLDTLRSVLEAEEKYANLSLPFNVGEKPKFFLPHAEGAFGKNKRRQYNGGKQGFGARTRQNGFLDAQESSVNNFYMESPYERRHGVSANDFVPNRNYASRQQPIGSHRRQWRESNSNSYYPPHNDGRRGPPPVNMSDDSYLLASYPTPPAPNACQSVCASLQGLALTPSLTPTLTPTLTPQASPADRLLQGLNPEEFGAAALPPSAATRLADQGSRINAEDKFGDFCDETIFVLIKPRQKRNVEIAQQTSKWIFAPQTEKKILFFINKGKTVYLLFTVIQSHAFQGMAKYMDLYYEKSGKPTATVEWIYTSDLVYSKIRHLRNPYHENRPIYEGVDGQVIQEDVANELVRIYQEGKEAQQHYLPKAEAACQSSPFTK